jgi:hypothetical protein
MCNNITSHQSHKLMDHAPNAHHSQLESGHTDGPRPQTPADNSRKWKQTTKSTIRKQTLLQRMGRRKIELRDSILYQLEVPKATQIRQLQRKVIPKLLIPTILAPYHTTPLAGHTGYYKTYWRIAARYWWPGMNQTIREAVLNCGHCRLANSTNHHAQHILQALSMDKPFDIISMDVWHPGKTDKIGLTEKVHKVILTSLCNMTGFASPAFLSELTSELVTRLAFSHIFIPNGLPKLILIHDGSKFKGLLIQMCKAIGLQYYVACPEAHSAILCK